MGNRVTEIIWTNPAKEDLYDVFEYLARFSEDAAFRVVNKILDKVEILRGGSPGLGQREPLLRHREEVYRYLVEGNHKIIYSIRNDKAIIHTVFDARQNPKKLERKVK